MKDIKWHVYENVGDDYALVRELDCTDPGTYEPHDMAAWVAEYDTQEEAVAHVDKFNGISEPEVKEPEVKENEAAQRVDELLSTPHKESLPVPTGLEAIQLNSDAMGYAYAVKWNELCREWWADDLIKVPYFDIAHKHDTVPFFALAESQAVQDFFLSGTERDEDELWEDWLANSEIRQIPLNELAQRNSE